MDTSSYDIIDITGEDFQTQTLALIHTLKSGNKNVVLLKFFNLYPNL